MEDLAIVNIDTGEKKSIETATNEEISVYLGNVKGQLKKLKQLESAIKKYVENERGLEFEDTESGTPTAHFLDHTIRQQERYTFDKTTFLKKASDKEKQVLELAEKIQKKYQKVTSYLVWK